MINDAKSKLNKLRSQGPWDDSVLEIFKDWDKQLSYLDLEKNYLELPQSVAIAKEIKSRIEDIDNDLLNKRSMGITERESLFNLKEICLMVQSHYSLEDNLKQTSIIEDQIDNDLKK